MEVLATFYNKRQQVKINTSSLMKLAMKVYTLCTKIEEIAWMDYESLLTLRWVYVE